MTNKKKSIYFDCYPHTDTRTHTRIHSDGYVLVTVRKEGAKRNKPKKANKKKTKKNPPADPT